ncbi:MAG TPA: ABC transporter ATP-binding protein [Thermotogota bacterium]|nr:ABC transporter ATP-binding protein [Thermotogota bacterium]HQQ66408.1 ABC transporter ATP-binding protein [Thermotogota bacterium]
MSEVTVKEVKKYFNQVKALDGVNIKIEDGEFVVLLGPSGCGKTTLLRCISGLEAVTSGEIRFGQKEVTHLPPKGRNLAMVFQSYAVWPHMKVKENIKYPMRIKKFPKEEIDRRTKETAELLNISELMDRYPAQLSGGQRQRVAVARAIVLEPAALLMDEPLSNLDALLRVTMRSELKKLQQRIQTTTIYVTHDQVEAMTMGDRIAVMRNGRILQFGKAEEIYQRPNNIFIAGFIGSPQMNFLEMSVKRREGRLELTSKNLSVICEEERAKHLFDSGIDQVIMGIRPENILLTEEKDCVPVEGTVYFTERLGGETIVHVSTESKRFVVKVSGDAIFKENENLRIYLNVKKIRLFHPETEEAID